MLLRQPSISTQSPRVEHVAALRRRRRAPGDDVDAVHRGDREHAATLAVAQADLVLAPGLAGDVTLAVVPVHGQDPAGPAIPDLDVDGHAGEGRERQAQGQEGRGAKGIEVHVGSRTEGLAYSNAGWLSDGFVYTIVHTNNRKNERRSASMQKGFFSRFSRPGQVETLAPGRRPAGRSRRRGGLERRQDREGIARNEASPTGPESGDFAARGPGSPGLVQDPGTWLPDPHQRRPAGVHGSLPAAILETRSANATPPVRTDVFLVAARKNAAATDGSRRPLTQ